MKNILLSCFFILFSFGVSAQGWKDLNSQVLELYKNKEFEKALPIAEQTIKAVKKELGEILGYSSRVSEILSRKRKLTLEMVRNLHEKLNIPLESLVQVY